MSDSYAPGECLAKWRAWVRAALIAALLPALAVCNAAKAQVGMVSPTPSIGATSPLGITTGSTVSPTGIPLGSTEIASPGVSPAPLVTGTVSMPGSGTSCSTLGTSPSGMYGSTATYDGGGMATGTTAPATAATSGMSTSSGMSATSGMSTTSGMLETSGMSGMCGSGSSSVAASSTPMSTSPTAPGGAARTGIPLGSTEIGNLGVSSAAALPMINVLPTTSAVGTSTSSTAPGTNGTSITPGG
jgi:hypothetical protein